MLATKLSQAVAHTCRVRSNPSWRRRRGAFLAATLICVPALAACRGDSGGGEAALVPGGADPGDVEVIDAWSSELRRGHVGAAARYFALPSLAQNGDSVRIRDLDDARGFNASLPCGAVLKRAESEDGVTTATFRLTERPGPGSCGQGTGGTAYAAFVIEDGEIVRWRRVVPAAPEPTPGRTF